MSPHDSMAHAERAADAVTEDGYPTDSALARITAWPDADPLGWFAFIKTCWWAADWGWTEYDGSERGHVQRVYQISTGGWSGNESIIGAMEKNRYGWFFFAYAWRRGGHYEFRVPASFLRQSEARSADAIKNEDGAAPHREESRGTLASPETGSDARACDQCGVRDGSVVVEQEPYPDRETGYVGTRALCGRCDYRGGATKDTEA